MEILIFTVVMWGSGYGLMVLGEKLDNDVLKYSAIGVLLLWGIIAMVLGGPMEPNYRYDG